VRKVLAWSVVTLVVLLVVGLGAGGWYYSDQLLPAALPPDPEYVVEVAAVDEDAGTITLGVNDGDLVDLGTVGLRTESGLLLLDGDVEAAVAGVTRRATVLTGDWPSPGDLAAPTVDTFAGDPATTLGLPYETVTIPSDLGPLPAWRVVPNGAGEAGTWVVLIHGRGGALSEGNRTLSSVYALGLPTLTISVRNDPDAAADPDGFGRYGATEWEDLQAAVDHLVRVEGAERLVLVGYSQGGSIALSFLRNSPEADLVEAAVLVSPLVSLPATLELQARNRGIPDPVIPPLLFATGIVSQLRAGLDVGEVDHLAAVDELPAELPMLVTHGTADTTVPIGPSRELARALPDTVRFEEYVGVDHVREWNADRARFEADLAAFLDEAALTPAG
jgi:pimeloyl-ACP methyl ester carboxylesterase